jgi:hypothetical protein
MLAFLILIGLNSPAAAEVKVVVEGVGDDFPHYLEMTAAPVIENGSTLIPIRSLCEDLGFQVGWDQAVNGVTIEGNEKCIRMTIGSTRALVNGSPATISAPPRIIDSSTMVPLRFISETLGYFVEYSTAWNNTQQVFVTPYTLVSDSKLATVDDLNFCRLADNRADMDGTVNLQLKGNGLTPEGIQIGSSIKDILHVYGVPRSPYRHLNYSNDWSGKLVYWGTFIPQSGMGTFFEFDFDCGSLTALTISY